MLLHQPLEGHAVRTPRKEALVCGGERLTYAEFDARANRLAHSLARAGIGRGDRVVLFLPNSAETAVGIFAVLKAGAVFVVVHPGTKEAKLHYILNNCRASGLIAPAEILSAMLDGRNGLPHLKAVWAAGVPDGSEPEGIPFFRVDREWSDGAHPAAAPENRCIDVDLAALIYTSGSTGQPKGVMMTHLNMLSAARSITTYLENREDDIVLSALPLSFDYGLYQLLMVLYFGGTLILERSFAFPHVLLSKAAEERVTGLPVVPTNVAVLLGMDLSQYPLPSLRYITSTAQALPVEHIQRMRAAYPHARLYSMYGLTECKRVSYLPPDQLDKRPGSIGRGMPNEEVYLVDEQGNRVRPGVIGELVVRGSNVMRGYWELPEETGRVLRPGDIPGERVLHTGDLFYADEEGYLYFVERKDDMIKSQGEKVSSREVENVIAALKGVIECAVIGVPDPILGSAIKVVIHRDPCAAITERDVLSHCAQELESFKIPRIVEFRDRMPVTDTGKINKRSLAAGA